MPAVILIGASAMAIPLIHEAHALDLKVIATDGDPAAPGFAHADERLIISTYEATQTATLLRHLADQYAYRGVVCCGADVAPTVATVAQTYQLPGIPAHIASQTHDKGIVRFVLDTGLSCYQPYWQAYDRALPSDALDALLAKVGYPLVVKPRTQRASRGVSLVNTRDELMDAIAKADRYGRHMLLERRLFGSEHSAEAILQDGTLLWFNIVDRLFDYASGTPIELGHINPTSLDAKIQQQIQLMLLSCARLLGVTWGPFKVDCMVTDDGPKVLEVTARLSGGWDCQRTSPMTGRNPIRQLLQLACGLPVDAQPPAQGYAACAAVLPTQPLAHNGERQAFVFTHGDDAALAWQTALAQAHAMPSASVG